MKKWQPKLPARLVSALLVLGVVFGLSVINRNSKSAATSLAPQNVRVTNITDTTATITWQTTDECLCGTNLYPGDKEVNVVQSTNPKRTHFVQLTNLSPQTDYEFDISTGATKFTNAGLRWKFTTAGPLTTTRDPTFATGRIVDKAGLPVSGALVMLTAPDLSAQSVLTGANGTWLIPLTFARTTDLADYTKLEDVLTVSVIYENPTAKPTFAKVLASGLNPVPELVIGETYDFTKSPGALPSELPKAKMVLPTTSPQLP